MKNLKITQSKTDDQHRIFVHADGTEQPILCAFDLLNYCTPDCASCHPLGVDDLKRECWRNGSDHEFPIGMVKS
jgi:hypothetical protein